MIRISDILDTISDNNPDADLDLIDRAYIYSARVHAGQMRLSGEPYLSHPLEVAAIVAEMNLDVESVAAALLHDVVEDTHATAEEIEEMFGSDVSHIVAGVTKLSKLTFSTKVAQQAESLRKMILAMADDLRVILIKLTDRVHNMRTLKYHKNPEKQKLIAQETLDIYAPIAARLGIFWIKQELEDIAFFYTLPDEYEKINSLVNKAKEEKENYIEIVRKKLVNEVEKTGFKAEIKGRFKNPYSIYHKMLSQELEFEEIYDVIAFRIILDSVTECYAIMGLIHSIWTPINNKIKDYIGNPKPNMYQSIHTTVVGPSGERVEIQIRTWEMHRIAESGVAAHWSYKEGMRIEQGTNEAFAWIRNLVENQENYKDPDEFLENVKIDLFPDEIYVFTPMGEIRTLPRNATPLDFAYLIHTEVGHSCKGAKVNSALVPLSSRLKTGDRVEIITSKTQSPSPDWLNIVKSVKAKSKIRQWLNAREKERSISLGKEMCDKVFRKKSHSFAKALKSNKITEVSQSFGFEIVEELLAQVGFGNITPLQVLNRAFPDLEKLEQQHKRTLLKKLLPGKKKNKDNNGVIVKGLNDILVKFAKCCNPLPGDAIDGYITQGEGVTIHRKNCVNILKMSPERQIDVSWSSDETEDQYLVSLRIRCHDRSGLLADMANTISNNKSNIQSTRSETSEVGIAYFYFTITVENSGHLQKIISELKKVKKVKDVKRIVIS
jgi:GTP diphosphokinase / guanosine-3',5'-bis(diphosphate) 3'-diphosphatase